MDCDLLREGALLDAVSITLAANGQTSWSIDGAFTAADTTDFAGSVRCDCRRGRARFSAIALEMDSGTRVFTTLAGHGGEPALYASGTTRATTLNFAHFANGGSIIIRAGVRESGDAAERPPAQSLRSGHSCDAPGDLLLRPGGQSDCSGNGGGYRRRSGGHRGRRPDGPDRDGAAGRTHGLYPRPGGDLVTGSVKVVSEGPIGGMLRYDLPHVGQAVVGAGAATSDAIFPVRRRQGGINTGVAIHNLESTEAVVNCELLREGALLDAVSITLAANGQISWSIDEAFTAADTTDFAGSVRCTAGRRRSLQRHSPGNGLRHPHLHHTAGRGGRREDVSGIERREVNGPGAIRRPRTTGTISIPEGPPGTKGPGMSHDPSLLAAELLPAGSRRSAGPLFREPGPGKGNSTLRPGSNCPTSGATPWRPSSGRSSR